MYAGLIMKVTRLCNLRCNYCHDWRSAGGHMDFKTLARITASALTTFDNVQFIWHGGETTVVPIEFYQQALAIQGRFLRPGCIVRNDIQTNATQLDDKWASFFIENKFGVGVSLDGPPELHDKHRHFANGQGSFEKVMEGITLLKNHGMKTSILMVIDHDTLKLGPKRIFDFCLEHGIKNFGCLPSLPANLPDAIPGALPVKDYVEPREMTDFLCRLFDIWLEHGDWEIKIRELQVIINKLRGKGGACTLEGECLGHYFIAEPEGDLGHCDLFLGDGDYSYGNIENIGFSEILECEKLSILRARNEESKAVMKINCPEFGICSGGCPHDRYISYRHNPHHSSKCCGMSTLISYVRDRLSAGTVANPNLMAIKY